MNITLKSFANIRDVVGEAELKMALLPGATLATLLDELTNRYGEKFDKQVKDMSTGLLVPFLILINDQTYRTLTDMDTQLQDGDVVTMMIPFDGG
ncbi:MAG: MoaD family protein [bacterium]|nr:MoaD family protein [bacterium]